MDSSAHLNHGWDVVEVFFSIQSDLVCLQINGNKIMFDSTLSTVVWCGVCVCVCVCVWCVYGKKDSQINIIECLCYQNCIKIPSGD